MRIFDFICILVALAAIISAFILVVHQNGKSKGTMNQLSKMLDDAMDGCFQEGVYDESRFSALESRMSQYLTRCSLSSKNLETEKEKIKELISDISHQTKTPISNILLYAQLLAEHKLSEEDMACVKALSEQADKLNFLIAGMIKISRLESGIIAVSPDQQPILVMLNSVMEQIKPKAEAKHIKITLEDTSLLALFDLKWTIEAVYNILDNAVKYSPDQSTITIKTTPYEFFCRIDISDQGIGIAEEEISKIFARFYRSPAVRNQEGVGIGLFLSREIISAEGGYIKVVSKRGKGATFSVFLPVE